MREFRLTEEHIKLLREANVWWQGAEFGAPGIDPKRPYGNGDVIRDMVKILGGCSSTCPHCGEPTNQEDMDRLGELHFELETALQILLQHAEIEPGRFIADPYSRKWKSAP